MVKKQTYIPVSNIVPLVFREGASLLELIHGLAKYVQDTLEPSLKHVVDNVVAEVEAQMDQAKADYVAGVQEFQKIHDAFMSDVNANLVALNDHAVTRLVKDSESQLHSALREVFATQSDLEDQVDSLNTVNSRVSTIEKTTRKSSTQNVDIHVAMSGDDNNDGSNSANAVQTLAEAVNRVPEVIRKGHVYTVHIHHGVWNEDFILDDRDVRGELRIVGTSTDRQNHRVRRMQFTDIVGYVFIENIESIQKNRAAFVFTRCVPHMELINVSNIDDVSSKGATGVHGVLADFGSQVVVRRSHFENKRYALRSNYLSRVSSFDNTGRNNTFGVGSRWGGMSTVYGTIPGADTSTTADSGGLVVHSEGARVGVDRREPDKGYDELALVERHSVRGIEDNYPIKQWLGRPHNLQVFNDDIPPGGRLRLFFRMERNVSMPSILEVSASYIPVSSGSTPRWRSVQFGGMLSFTRFTNTIPYFVSGVPGSTGHNMIQLRHSGDNGVFYVDLVPQDSLGARGGWYGLDVKFSGYRNYSAPILYDAKILST